MNRSLLFVGIGMIVSSAFAQSERSAEATAQLEELLPRVEVEAKRADDLERRKRSTAATVVIGRDALDRYGDASVEDVLRRIPGVTQSGAPGRGGAPRLRGMSEAHTQILVDGQRMAPGVTLETLTPDQIERIEVIRAPTAETGTQAMGGTINIVLREGARKPSMDLRVSARAEAGRVSPALSVTRVDVQDDMTATTTAYLFAHRQRTENDVHTQMRDALGLFDDSVEHASTVEARHGLALNTRLQWKLANGESVMLQPALYTALTPTADSQSVLAGWAPPYTQSATQADRQYGSLRLNGQWKLRLGEGWSAELNGGGGVFRRTADSLRQELNDRDAVVRTVQDDLAIRQRNAYANLKLTRWIGDDDSVVSGLEIEHIARRQNRTLFEDAAAVWGDDAVLQEASSVRTALWSQYEWVVSPQINAYAGLRWEGLISRGDALHRGSIRHRTAVTSPLAHVLWKLDAQGQDQVRMALTRSYRAPELFDLMAQPTLSNRYAAYESNTPTSPDTAGNPDLLPETAMGVDLAFERITGQGQLLSIGVFHRRIRDLIRPVTALESVPWSDVPRWVTRPRNLGDAYTQGLELEGRTRLDDALPGWSRFDLNANLSVWRSRVDAVPGPDNRIADQPAWSATAGADGRLRALPVSLGITLTWAPGLRTQWTTDRYIRVDDKRLLDMYALWTVRPGMAWRLSVSNALARDFHTRTSVQSDGVEELADVSTPGRMQVQVRLEMKL